jgi:hypothetical protein
MELHNATHMDARLASATDPTLLALQAAIGAQLAAAPSADGTDLPQLAPTIRLVCDDARRRGLRAEDVVILFKRAWAAVPGPDYGSEGNRRGELMERAITLCIKSYYSTAD